MHQTKVTSPFSPQAYNIITVVVCAMGSFGLVVQIVALCVFTKKTFREMNLNGLFMNITAANLIILLVEGPLLVGSSSFGHFYPNKTWICDLRGFVCGSASINMIVILLCIVTKIIKLVKGGQGYMPSDTVVIVASWVYSTLCMLPPFLGWGEFHVDPSGISCSIEWWTQTAANVSYIVALTMMAFIVPVGYLMFNLYTLRKYFLNQQNSISDMVNRNRRMYR